MHGHVCLSRFVMQNFSKKSVRLNYVSSLAVGGISRLAYVRSDNIMLCVKRELTNTLTRYRM